MSKPDFVLVYWNTRNKSYLGNQNQIVLYFIDEGCVESCFLFSSDIIDELRCTILNSISISSNVINKFFNIIHIIQDPFCCV